MKDCHTVFLNICRWNTVYFCFSYINCPDIRSILALSLLADVIKTIFIFCLQYILIYINIFIGSYLKSDKYLWNVNVRKCMAKMCLCSNVSKKVERNVRVVILILAVGYIVEVRTAFVFHTAQGHIRPSQSRDGILEQHFYSRFLGINMGLLRLEFLSGILPSFFFSLRCYSRVDSICEFFASIFRTQSTV
jgi:hypothetical protein